MEGATVGHLACPVSAFCLIRDASQRDFCVWGGKTPGLGRRQAVLQKLLPLLRLSVSMGAPFKQNSD